MNREQIAPPWNEEPERPLALDRREFLKLAGLGIFVFFWADDPELLAAQEYPSDFNAFLRIGEDGRVACFSGKIEMGQGVITSLAQMLAEELDVPLSSVDMVLGDTSLCPWDMGTFGSRTTKYFGPALREAGAEARAVLIQIAAEELKVPEERLAVREGSVADRENPGRKVPYSALAKGKRIERRLGRKPALKPRASYTVSGKPAARKDGPDKVTGRARFTADVRVEGMVCARILRPPAHGAKLRSADTEEAEKVPGAQVVREGDLIAVLHALPDVAQEALEKIRAEWEVPEAKVDDGNLLDHLLQAKSRGNTVEQEGDLEKGKGLAAALVEATYFNRYVAHAPLEPHAALAHVTGKEATIWASTQRPFGTRDEVARALGLPRDSVRVIAPFVGGGFGGKSRNIQAVEAARLSRIAGRPVLVAFTREEEFFHDSFRPAAFVKISAGLDGSNRIVFWDYGVHFAGDRSCQCIYDIPHRRTASHGAGFGGGAEQVFETGAWRAPGSNTNVFARESHMDLLAERAGADPLAFRLAHLKDERLRRVLEAVAGKFGWSPAKSPGGKGQGVACADYLGTRVAAMAEVQADRETGSVRVERIACAQDMGEIINPEGARQQIEGCLQMGIGPALLEELHFRGGRILDLNFDTYEIPRFSHLPKIEAILVENPEVPPQGCGEPAIILVGAVLANAIRNAAGARLFDLPMTPERVKNAVAEAAKGKRST